MSSKAGGLVGSLRHRVTVQQRAAVQDPVTGEMSQDWADVATVWAAIEPLSVRDFIQSQAAQSQVSARIVMRYSPAVAGISGDIRVLHLRGTQPAIVYHAQSVLRDKTSGIDYITLACSQGARL